MGNRRRLRHGVPPQENDVGAASCALPCVGALKKCTESDLSLGNILAVLQL
jgi:hypothetical protein